MRGVKTDPERLTALVILGIRDKRHLPADLLPRELRRHAALTEADIDEDLIAAASARWSSPARTSAAPNLDATSRKAMRLAKAHGGRVVLDIDYRPVLWGLTGHGARRGALRRSATRSPRHLQTILPECDLVVGTEEEIHIAGGTHRHPGGDARGPRGWRPTALIVVKRGPMGCVAFPGPIPDDIDEGVTGRASRSRCSTCWAPATPS